MDWRGILGDVILLHLTCSLLLHMLSLRIALSRAGHPYGIYLRLLYTHLLFYVISFNIIYKVVKIYCPYTLWPGRIVIYLCVWLSTGRFQTISNDVCPNLFHITLKMSLFPLHNWNSRILSMCARTREAKDQNIDNFERRAFGETQKRSVHMQWKRSSRQYSSQPATVRNSTLAKRSKKKKKEEQTKKRKKRTENWTLKALKNVEPMKRRRR